MKLEAFGPAWKFFIPDDHSCAWTLLDTRQGEELVNIVWGKLNNISEKDALNEKCRFHSKLDNREVQIESANVYPFGGESLLERNLKLRDKLLEVCVDVKPGRGETVRSFELEDLIIPGEFSKIEIIRNLPEAGQDWQLEPLTATEDILYSAPQPWVAIVLTKVNGTILEIGIGGDYWRMQGCGDTLWQIIRNQDAVVLKSRPVALTAEETVERRPWRFSYYIAWGRNSSTRLMAEKNDITITPEVGKDLECSCFRAPSVRRTLRKFIRREQESSGNLHLILPDVTACQDAAHLERPGKKSLAHWDLEELFALYSWGNRQLGGERLLNIELPENSIFRKLPSGKYLSSIPGDCSIREI